MGRQYLESGGWQQTLWIAGQLRGLMYLRCLDKVVPAV